MSTYLENSVSGPRTIDEITHTIDEITHTIDVITHTIDVITHTIDVITRPEQNEPGRTMSFAEQRAEKPEEAAQQPKPTI